jgi:hypothetical protein
MKDKTIAISRDLLKQVTEYIDDSLDWQDTEEHREEIEGWSKGLHAAINASYPIQHGEWFGDEFSAYDECIGEGCSCGQYESNTVVVPKT